MLFNISVLFNITYCYWSTPHPHPSHHRNQSPFRKINKTFPYDIDLKNADGQVVNSSKLFKKNKRATVLLFWMTTCGPCRMELNAISGKFDTWKKKTDFDFYAISIDFSDRVEQFNTRVKKVNGLLLIWISIGNFDRSCQVN
ncbi:MAG: redoxin domain-containing protein [Saprospiraceae bacterium]|nr:redoxin domain-containing protein [Candidatus Defluviibacterium haderslevense]